MLITLNKRVSKPYTYFMVKMKNLKLIKFTSFIIFIFIFIIIVKVNFNLLQSISYYSILSNNSTQITQLLNQDKLKEKLDQLFIQFVNLDRSCNASYTKNETMMEEAKQWRLDESKFYLWIFGRSEDLCQSIRTSLAFCDLPLSLEENEFPLAYGMLVYQNSIQIYLQLSAIYHPQNHYCIAVDSKSSDDFMSEMIKLSDCFPNVFVMKVSKIEWGQYGVVHGLFSCFRYLTELKHDWKYYQYLTGVDLPLKTNLEMVRILKRLNGTNNLELMELETNRLKGKKHPYLKIWKTSMSALISRESANAIVASQKVRELLLFLKGTFVPDESIWATVTGHKNVLNFPGSFNASHIITVINQQSGSSRITLNTTNLTPEEPFPLDTYYISRYQVWYYKDDCKFKGNCKGTWTHESCVFGVEDLPNLLVRPEFFAHKIYLSFEPAAYFCLYKSIRLRAIDNVSQERFRGAVYEQLPMVRISAGARPEEVKFYF